MVKVKDNRSASRIINESEYDEGDNLISWISPSGKPMSRGMFTFRCLSENDEYVAINCMNCNLVFITDYPYDDEVAAMACGEECDQEIRNFIEDRRVGMC